MERENLNKTYFLRKKKHKFLSPHSHSQRFFFKYKSTRRIYSYFIYHNIEKQKNLLTFVTQYKF